MPRTFNGTSDKVTLANASGLNPSFPMAIAYLVFYNTTTGTTEKIMSRGQSNAGWSFSINGTRHPQFTKYGVVDIASATVLTTGKWYLLAAKIDNTSGVRFLVYDYAANTATFDTNSNTAAFTGTPSKTIFGCENLSGSDAAFFNGDIEVAGVWIGGAPSDDQMQNLAYNLDAWFEFKSPTSLWILDQQTTGQKIVDESQIANESSLTGTTVSTRSCPIWTPGHQVSGMAA